MLCNYSNDVPIYEEYQFEQIAIGHWCTSLLNQYRVLCTVHLWLTGSLGGIQLYSGQAVFNERCHGQSYSQVGPEVDEM